MPDQGSKFKKGNGATRSPKLSPAAQRLLALRIPVLCRGAAETNGLRQWQAYSAALNRRALWVNEIRRRALHALDEAIEQSAEGHYAFMVRQAGKLTAQVLASDPGVDPARLPRAVWDVLRWVSRFMDELGVDNALACPTPDPLEAARPMRGALEKLRLADAGARSRIGAEVNAVLDAVLSWDDTALGMLNCPVPPDVVSEFHGLTGDTGLDALIGPNEMARAGAMLKRAADASEALQAKFRAGETKFAEERKTYAALLADARGALPGTGETDDLILLIRDAEVAFGGEAPVGAAQRSVNRVYARGAVWLALGDISWGAEAREALAAMVSHPNKFARYEPQGEAGREAKRRLRKYRDAFVAYHPPHEQASLLAVLARPDATDDDVRWVLGEYLISRLPAGAPLGRMADEYAAALDEVLERDDFNLVRLLLQVRAYEAGVTLRTAVDAEIDRLISLDPSLAADVRAEPEAFPPVPRPSPPPAHEPPGQAAPRLAFTYVITPEAEHPRSATLWADADHAYDAIRALLEEHSETPEPVESLARAIHHFAFEVPAEHRQVWNKERVGGFVFHKLKRGSARIYVRVDGDTVFFHAYARRDWVKPDAFW